MKLVAFAVLSLFFSGVSNAAQGRYFTVRDSIEMARFDRANPHAEFSPDKKYFAIVTSRGIIRSNSIESTIWVFKVKAIQRFLRIGHKIRGFTPKIVARWSAIPRIPYDDSYESVISSLQWLPDSKTILFLARKFSCHTSAL